MKKQIAFLLCLMMILSLVSCNVNNDQDELSSNEKGDSSNVNDTTSKDDNDPPLLTEDDKAMQLFEAAIKGEICVFDERLGEIKLKDLRFTGSDKNLSECKLLKKASIDIDQDGINEYVIQSPDYEHIILRCYHNKVYSYRLDDCNYYNLNTDGTFYWCVFLEEPARMCGLNKIVFDGETLSIKSIYSLKDSKNDPKYEYFVAEEAATEEEYYNERDYHWFKENVKFSQFELTCSYPITAEQAWNLANAYWDNQDGRSDCSAGSTWMNRIVLIDVPNAETNYYRVAFQVERYSGGGLEGYECMPPSSIREYDQILVNAFTGEITTPACEAGDKAISIEEAMEIAKKHCEANYEKSKYRFEHAVNEPAPEHIYVIVVQKYNNDHYSFYTRMWIDKYTRDIVFEYYLYGK